jgi:mitochondrial chaperone BCS1
MKGIFENPVLTGAVALMVSGAVLYLLRSIPKQLLDAILRRATAEITVSDNSPAFGWAEEWLSDQPYSQHAKRVKIAHTYRNGERLIITPGYGRHWFWRDRRPVIINRENMAEKAGAGAGKEMLTIKTFDFGRSSIEGIYRQILAYSESRGSLRILSCDAWGNWQMLQKREHRKLASVFVPAEVKAQLIDHLQWYLDAKDWFYDHGIPYRTGFLLYGPPGTGKTSLVQAIAGVFDLTVYIMNPADLESDGALKRAIASVGTRSILLIEDADTSINSRTVETKPIAGPVDVANNVPVPPQVKGPTLSGILNAIDGIAASDGRILALTTNYIERLDPALIRPGRIDVKLEIGPMARAEALAMAASFFPELEPAELRDLVDHIGERTGAEWQRHLTEQLRARRAA